jgi:hypothetical protein
MTESKDIFNIEKDNSILSAFGWWEKRRWIYNIVVGFTGAFFMFLLPMVTSFDIIGIVIYGLLANLCYSLGFLIEVVARYYFKNETDFTDRRKLMFGAGLVISVLVTAFLATAWGLLSGGAPD